MDDFQQEVIGSLSRIEQKVENLAGPEGRVTKLERAAEAAEWRQWIRSLVAAVLAALGIKFWGSH